MNFKRSPFSTVVNSLTSVKEVPGTSSQTSSRDTALEGVLLTFYHLVVPQNRYNVGTRVTLDDELARRLRTDASLRIMVYCAADQVQRPAFNQLDIAFPRQSELRVNGEIVKASLGGVKKKPGSTKPADITQHIRTSSAGHNEIQLCYALTDKVWRASLPSPCETNIPSDGLWDGGVLMFSQKYYYVINLVQTHSVDELVAKIKAGNVISKERVIRESESIH